jgi:prepilin-type N-terminal cleavage/methylation domain-containing protein/prepilin-type processing-associated H-X9-DG protein
MAAWSQLGRIRDRAVRRGFTLVELLVVIGIIALLISILLPALNQAREQSKQVADLSNMRQIGTAALMFANEHSQHVPLAGELWGTGVDGTPAGLQDRGQKLWTYFNDSGTTRIMPMNCALAPYLGKATLDSSSAANMTADINNSQVRRIFTCPSQIENPQQAMMVASSLGWQGPLQYCSYGYNEEVVGWGTPNDGSGVTGHSRARGQVSRIGHAPADTFYMCDALPRSGTPWIEFYAHPIGATLGDCFTNGNGSGDTSQFDLVRHRGKMCILFMDGHAEKFDMNANALIPVLIDPPGFGS